MTDLTQTPDAIVDSRERILNLCEERIGYRFRDRSLLARALTHSSAANTRLDCNERMEFLGDSVLSLVVCEYLFQSFPNHREGQLTQQKSHLVSRTVCAQVADRLSVDELLFVGKGLATVPSSIKAAAVEAAHRRSFLDGGINEARRFVEASFRPELQNCDDGDVENYKSLLQEETQREGNNVPAYIVLDQRGPDHAREFCIAVVLGERRFPSAWGRSKKSAEQKAARNAMRCLEAVDHDESSAVSGETNGNDTHG